MTNGVGVGKASGKAGGYFYRAPIGTALPTDAKTPLPAAYKAVSLISSDGVSNSIEDGSNNITDMTGEVVYSASSSRTETLGCTLIETTKTSMECVHGEAAVSGTDESFSVAHTDADRGSYVYVWEIILRDNLLKRIVAPNAKVTAVAEVNHRPGDPVGYPITITAAKDTTAGYSVKEFVDVVSDEGSDVEGE